MKMETQNLSEIMEQIEKKLNENPEPIKNIQSLYQFEISGEEEATYQLDIQNGTAKVTEGIKTEADCTLKMSLKNFHKFLAGKLNGTTAFMTGKLKVNGDMTKALKLESLFKQYTLD